MVKVGEQGIFLSDDTAKKISPYILSQLKKTLVLNLNSVQSSTETDPVFTAWLSTPPNLSTFTNDAGYLTFFSETDPIFSLWQSTYDNHADWDTAYGWGNHATAGYLLSATAATTYQTILVSGTSIKTINSTSLLGSGDIAITANSLLPSQTANSGKYLTTDGTNTSWATVASGSSLSGLTAATTTNIINNGDFKQEWQWNSLANNTGFKLSSTSGGLLNTQNRLFEVEMSGAMPGTGNSSYAGYFKNTQTNGGAYGLYAQGGGTSILANGAINIQSGSLQLGGGSGALFYRNSGTTFLQSSTGEQLILVSQQSSVGNINFLCSVAPTDIGFQIAKKTLNQHYIFGLGGARYNGNYVSASSTSACIMERNANKIIFSANSGLPGAGTAIYVPNNILTINGGATEATSNVGIGTTTPVASAKLEVSSTTSGFLPPRMTATQASAISSPAKGLILYATDTDGTFTSAGLWMYNGTIWKLILAE